MQTSANFDHSNNEMPPSVQFPVTLTILSGLSIQLNIKGNIQDMSDIALMTNGASWLAEGGGGGGGDQSGVGDGRAL